MSETQSAQKESTTVNLLDLPVTNENEALNVMVGFLGLAQKRGCFAINEAAKIYECVKLFQKPASNTGSN
ncbi:hypothetical protein N9P79_01115 [Crocinitomicaceae bacterium]|jgi:hypothetical protein|nr:hypothetical protein [Crocinitomicaceae bacterium]